MEQILERIDAFLWGPVLIVLLLATGVMLAVRMRFLPFRNLRHAFACAAGRERRGKDGRAEENKIRQSKKGGIAREKGGDISPFSALTTELAATIGTGNIVGVATAMTLGGPGALLWMVAAAFPGMAIRLAESALSVRWRIRTPRGETAGGPMYTMARRLRPAPLGRFLGALFALAAVFASFGIGSMTQSNSISSALSESFGLPPAETGLAVTILTILVLLGGAGMVSRVTSVLVPGMALFYIAGAAVVLLGRREAIPTALCQIVRSAFGWQAAVGGFGGAAMREAVRWGVARGVFTNEAGLGAAGISAAAARTDSPVRQGYISMTGVFLDTVVLCTLTGLVIAASGVLGSTDASGEPLTGAGLAIAAFSTVLGEKGGAFISAGIALFAFATILGWAYQGEKAFAYLAGGREDACLAYRMVYALSVFAGAVCTLQAVWNFSDILNALMAFPNLLCLWMLSGEVSRDVRTYGRRRGRR